MVEAEMDVSDELDELRAVEPDNWLVRRLLIADRGPYLLSAGNTGAVFVRKSAGACAMLFNPCDSSRAQTDRFLFGVVVRRRDPKQDEIS